MHVNILWTSPEYNSLENCRITIQPEGWDIDSVILGNYDQVIYRVQYNIVVNQHSDLLALNFQSQVDNRQHRLELAHDTKGNWLLNGNPAPQWEGCREVDISLTPFTNTLPVNRLKPAIGQERQIRVVYIDVLTEQVKAVFQKYTRLAGNEYKYENVPNDFEAIIKVDELGLVIEYPSLFTMDASAITE